jgi:hypothetical protein
MANNWKALGCALLLVGMVLGCTSRKGGQDFRGAIIDADTLWAYKVDGYPVAPGEQRRDLRYIFGYPVQKVHPLLAHEVLMLRTVVSDPSTFDTTAVKSCPMVAQYAFAVRKKGKTPVAVVISPAPCGKALIFHSKNADKPISMELSIGNRLEEVLAGMW